MSSSTSWSDLPPDLLGLVLNRLPLPADRARFRAVCRAWHSAARHHTRQIPWIVFPDGSFGTMGRTWRLVDDGCSYFPAGTIPGLPENVTCLGAAAIGWLALDCTDDVFRRTPYWDKFVDCCFLQPRRDVKHRHSYRLYNPFTGKTVLLPELDSVIGEVPETFEVRKVLMQRRPSSLVDTSPDDDDEPPPLVAIITNNYNCNIIICRPGKGNCWVLPAIIDVFDIAFHGDRLYGITPEEDLVALDLAENDKGEPVVTKCWRVIKKPLADGEEGLRSWEYDDSIDDDDDDDDGIINDDGDNSDGNNNDDEDDIFNDDYPVSHGEDTEKVEVENYPDVISSTTTRRLVQSSRGDGDDEELLMVRHHCEISQTLGTYTLDVDILKADMEAGKWVPVSELDDGQALFLSRSFSTSTRAYGDIKQGCIYSTDVDDVFDTKSRGCTLIRFPIGWKKADHKLLTWLFPPELQL